MMGSVKDMIIADAVWLEGLAFNKSGPQADRLRAIAHRLRHELPAAEVQRLTEALNLIDALDPESAVNGCHPDALRGLVNRMGQIARAALTAALKAGE
jgi:hypothetical protein